MATNDVADAYVLPRDEEERARLDFQHFYMKRIATDDRIIYNKRVVISPGDRVLDCATGTGAWVIDAASQLPEAVDIQAVDLSSNNFPSMYPSNVHFSLASVTELPEGWSNSFDLVNQRLLFAALLRAQWAEALSEMYRVLKPGGAIQLVEADFFQPIPESPIVSHFRKIHEECGELIGLIPRVGSKLHEMLLAAGFVGVTSETKRMPVGKLWGEIGEAGKKCFGGAFRRIPGLFTRTGFVASEEEYEMLMDKLEQEWDEKGTEYHCMIVCARKPFVAV